MFYSKSYNIKEGIEMVNYNLRKWALVYDTSVNNWAVVLGIRGNKIDLRYQGSNITVSTYDYRKNLEVWG